MLFPAGNVKVQDAVLLDAVYAPSGSDTHQFAALVVVNDVAASGDKVTATAVGVVLAGTLKSSR